MILVLWSLKAHKFQFIEVSDNPEERSMERLLIRVRQNIDKFDFFATFTFTDKVSGFYPITDRLLERKLRRWLKKPNGKRYKYEKKDTLDFIFYNHDSIMKYMRKKLDLINKTLVKLTTHRLSYFWKVELGKKTKRPHFHLLFSHPNFKQITKFMWALFESKWKSGYVDIEKITNTNKAINYLKKYISKTCQNSIYIPRGSRRWSSSRDLPKYLKTNEYIFNRMSPSAEENYFNFKVVLEELYVLKRLFYDHRSATFEFLSS